ncbi:MAG: hypothetical protein HYZ49_08130 [Chloroflexi bacterium]|nr:hypothetical protein [Chloroflexota bacterium]
MQLDKELYRKTYESFKQWNDAKLLDRVRDADKLTPAELWHRYVDLWEFAKKIAPPQSERQQAQAFTEWVEYYAKMQKFEAWRRAHGKRA